MTDAYIEAGINDLYEHWLLDCYPEEVRTKDQSIDLVSGGYLWDEFKEEVKKVLEE